MITIPFPIFTAITIVLCLGYTINFNKYIRLTSLVLYLGFWFSFNASDVPSFDITAIDNTIWYVIGKATIAIIVVVLGMFYLKKFISK